MITQKKLVVVWVVRWETSVALARAGRTAGRDTAPGGQADQVQRSQPAAISGLRSLVGDTGRS